MKYLAAKLSTAQEARAQGKIETEKIDESSHPHGPSEDHRIARTSNLRPYPHAMGGKKEVTSLGPAHARGVPGARAEGTGRCTTAIIPQYTAVSMRAKLCELPPRKAKCRDSLTGLG